MRHPRYTMFKGWIGKHGMNLLGKRHLVHVRGRHKASRGRDLGVVSVAVVGDPASCREGHDKHGLGRKVLFSDHGGSV
eukprot:scaffold1224_cov136-Amphora_coffeaeformis.AAC.4